MVKTWADHPVIFRHTILQRCLLRMAAYRVEETMEVAETLNEKISKYCQVTRIHLPMQAQEMCSR